MKILVIGSGGREHTITWKLAQSEKCTKIFVSPGNGGTANEKKTENLPFPIDPSTEEGQKQLLEFAKKEKIDLTIVGPEAPLASGIVDFFKKEGLPIIGPDKNAAKLESSKVFAKDFMEKYGARTSKSRNFAAFSSAIDFSRKYGCNPGKKLVIKADGLAAGKGVVIVQSPQEAESCLNSFLKESKLGDAGKSVVIEEFLEGREISILAAVSVNPGKENIIMPFIPASDHKNRYEGGKGPNTGGMGSIAPVPDFGKNAYDNFEKSILLPTLNGMKKEKMNYSGFIFFGLMVKNDTCSLLEYNVRLGDPETQAVLPLMKSDFLELCTAISSGNLSSFKLEWENKSACVPVLATNGYPDAYRSGDKIHIDKTELEKLNVNLFFAGAKNSGSEFETSGGRVLSVCALGNNGEEARTKAYAAINFVSFEGMSYRKDIGLSDG